MRLGKKLALVMVLSTVATMLFAASALAFGRTMPPELGPSITSTRLKK